MSKDAIVIVAAARTPMGGLQGDFKDLAAPALGDDLDPRVGKEHPETHPDQRVIVDQHHPGHDRSPWPEPSKAGPAIF